MPALDLALGHRMIGRAAQVFDVAVVEPFGQVVGDVAGTVVEQEPGPIGEYGLVQSASLQRQVEGGGDILGPHVGAQLPGEDVAREVVKHGRQVEPAPNRSLSDK